MKNINLKLWLCAIMLCAVTSANAHDFEVDGIYYNITSSSEPLTVAVTYRGSSYDSYNNRYSGSVTIPETVTYNGKTYSVTCIDKRAFSWCTSLTSVTIPSSVVIIGESAFDACSSLQSISIPNSVTSISYLAFWGCTELTSITIPESVTKIGERAFEDCTGLTSVTINSDAIASKSYSSSSTLANIFGSQVTEYSFGEGVQRIGEYACCNCSKLTSITIPESVNSIGGSAFSGCGGLTSIIIPNSVTKIGDKAFSGCSGLTSVTIPSSVTSIGSSAFDGCTGLTHAEFASIENFCSIQFGDRKANPLYYSHHLFVNGNEVEDIVLPNGLTEIDNRFRGCVSIQELTIPSSVSYIGDYAFSGCSSLTSVTIPSSVTAIGNSTFSNCSGLVSVTIPNSVTSIGGFAFNGCSGLTSVFIGKSVTSIGGGVFSGCSGLTSVTINSDAIASKSYSSSSTLSNIFGSQVTNYIFGEDVKRIGEYACYNCSKLTSVTIPNSVTSIGSGAFSGCNSLTSITIPNSITSIGNSAFYGCIGLTSITIPESVTSIGEDAFFGCTGLTKLTIEPRVAYEGYDVTDNISSYEERKKQWVWDTSKNAWYVLNNKQEYEAYGVYGTDKDTWYDGKLAIVDEHEWEYADGKWNDLGTVTSTQTVEYIAKINEGGDSEIDLGVPFKSNTRIQIKFYPTNGGGGAILGDKDGGSDSKDWRFFFSGGMLYYDFDSSRNTASRSINTLYEWEVGNYYIKEIGATSNILSGTAHTDFSNRTRNMYLGEGSKDFARFYYVKIYEGETLVKDFVPYFDGAAYGLWDNISKKAYMPTGEAWTGEKTGTLEYPKYYVEKETPYIVPSLSINHNAFNGCRGLTSVTIPNSVTSIGNTVFYNCSGLTSVTINSNSVASKGYTSSSTLGSIFGSQVRSYIFGDDVKSIGEYACYNCSKLTSVTIGSSVTCIGEKAFASCGDLTSIFVESGNIIYDSRNKCNAIIESSSNTLLTGCKNTTIPNNVVSIGINAFYNCSGLTSIPIPESVISIGSGAFSGCSGLTKAEFSSIESLCSIQFSDYDANPLAYAHHLYIDGTEVTSVAIPESVTSIGYYAFYSCEGLTTVTIPESVTSIGRYAFLYCRSLTSVTIPKSVTSIGNRAFDGCSALTSVTINSDAIASKSYSSSSMLSNMFGSQVRSYIFGDDVKSIGEYACYNCSKLTSVTIGNSVTRIGSNAFDGCSSLTYVNINCLTVGRWFCGNTSIQQLAIGNNVTCIDKEAFSGCTGLTSITIPAKVTNIREGAFDDCSGLKNLVFEDGESTLSLAYNDYNSSKSMFYDCPLQTLYLGRNISYKTDKDYGFSPFYSKSSLTSVTVGDSVTSIGDYAFSGCSSLATISMGNNVKKIGIDAFKDTPWYKNQSGVVYAGYVAYGYRGSISEFKKLELNEGTLGIASGAFAGCSDLISTSIPASVKSIGSGAFKDCSKLTRSNFASIESLCGMEFGDKDANPLSFTGRLQVNGKDVTELVIPDNVPDIGSYTFYNCHEFTSVSIGNNVKNIGESAFYGCSEITAITIPSSVTNIGNYAFNYCGKLSDVVFEDGTEKLTIGCGYYDNTSSMYWHEGWGFFYPTGLKTLYLGRNLEYSTHWRAGHSPFYNTGLTSVTIGKNVTNIGENAFLDCRYLTKAEFSSIESLCSMEFSNAEANPLYYAHNLYINGNRVTDIVIPNGVKSIVSNAFRNAYVTSVTIPSNVTNIGGSAFEGCKGLTKVEFSNLESLCDMKFGSAESNPLYYAHHLYIGGTEVTDVVIPNSVKDIGQNAFRNANYLVSITIPNSVTDIGISAFEECSGLTSLSLGNGVKDISSYAFKNCKKLSTISIPNSVAAIGEEAFRDCSGLTSVSFGNGVTTIGKCAFYGCNSLTSVTVPNSVISIGQGAFQNCTGLTDLTIKNRPKLIYDGYDVVNDISSYKGSKEQWVWDTSKNAWYVLNNKQEYEAYGVYGTDKEIWYEGKLAIVDGHEWEYSGGKWNDLGKTTDTQVVEYIERNSDNTGHIDLGVTFKANTKIQLKYYPTNAGGRAILGDWNTNENDDWRIFFAGSTLFYDFDSSRQSTSKSLNTLYEWEIGNYYIRNIGSTSNILSGTAHTDFSNRTHNILLGTHGGSTNGDEGTDYGRVYYVKIYEGETLVKDFVPYFDGAAYGLWDNISKKAYMPTGGAWTGNEAIKIDYLKEYVRKEEPYIAPSFGMSLGESAFENCSKLSTIAIPNSIKSIGKKAFNGCNNLEDLTIGNSVTFIGEGAFGSSDHISHLLVKCATPPSAANAFSDKTYDYTTLYVPIGKVEDYAYDDTWYRFYTVKESTVTAEESEATNAYTLMDVKTFNYATYDAENKNVKMVAASEVNEKDPNHCWQTVEVSGLKFLYNIGGKKFAVPTTEGSAFRLSENVGSISMENGDDGIILGGNSNWQWALVIDENMDADMSLEETVVTGVEEINVDTNNAGPIYDLNGRRITNPTKGIYIRDRKKVVM